MNKKLLLVAGIGIAAYFFLGSNSSASSTDNPSDSNDVFVKYNNMWLQDSKGTWFFMKDGKLFLASAQTQASWNGISPVTIVPENIWETYVNLPGRFGGEI